MSDLEYMEFCCNDLNHPCEWRTQARTKDEVMEQAKAHMASEHGVTEPGRDTEEKIEGAIRSVKTKAEDVTESAKEKI